jgi:hypothetical protein
MGTDFAMVGDEACLRPPPDHHAVLTAVSGLFQRTSHHL